MSYGEPLLGGDPDDLRAMKRARGKNAADVEAAKGRASVSFGVSDSEESCEAPSGDDEAVEREEQPAWKGGRRSSRRIFIPAAASEQTRNPLKQNEEQKKRNIDAFLTHIKAEQHRRADDRASQPGTAALAEHGDPITTNIYIGNLVR